MINCTAKIIQNDKLPSVGTRQQLYP